MWPITNTQNCTRRASHLPRSTRALPARCSWPRGGLHPLQRDKGRCEEGRWSQSPAFLVQVTFLRGGEQEWGAAPLILGTLKTFFISCVLSSSSVTTCSAPSFFSLSVSFWRSGLETKHEPQSHRLTFSTKGSRDCSAAAVTTCFFVGSWGPG